MPIQLGELSVDPQRGVIEHEGKAVDVLAWFHLPEHDGVRCFPKDLTQALANNHEITVLSLNDDADEADLTRIDFEDFEAWLQVLIAHPTITLLALDVFEYDIYQRLCEALKDKKNIPVLMLNHRIMDQDAMGPMLDLIESNPSIREVETGWCLVGEPMLDRLTDVLRKGKHIRSITLDDLPEEEVSIDQLKTEGGIASPSLEAFAACLLEHPALTSITLNSPFTMSEKAVDDVLERQRRCLCGDGFTFDMDERMAMPSSSHRLSAIIDLNQMVFKLTEVLDHFFTSEGGSTGPGRESLQALLGQPGVQTLVGDKNHLYLTALAQDFSMSDGYLRGQEVMTQLERLGYAEMSFKHIDYIKRQLAAHHDVARLTSSGMYKRPAGGSAGECDADDDRSKVMKY